MVSSGRVSPVISRVAVLSDIASRGVCLNGHAAPRSRVSAGSMPQRTVLCATYLTYFLSMKQSSAATWCIVLSIDLSRGTLFGEFQVARTGLQNSWQEETVTLDFIRLFEEMSFGVGE